MKKEQEQDELRGAVDGWDFKSYVLSTMFYYYISEDLCNYISGEIEADNTGFDYQKRLSVVEMLPTFLPTKTKIPIKSSREQWRPQTN